MGEERGKNGRRKTGAKVRMARAGISWTICPRYRADWLPMFIMHAQNLSDLDGHEMAIEYATSTRNQRIRGERGI